MYTFVDGKFIESGKASVPVNDRSFMYGDGLFETASVRESRVIALESHLKRLANGADFLGIPCEVGQIRDAVRAFVERNRLRNGIIRVHLSRGSSKRGLAVVGPVKPRLVIVGEEKIPFEQGSEHIGLRLGVVGGVKVDEGIPLTRFKTANRLIYILARLEANKGGYDDGILLNHANRIVGASAANLLWVKDGCIFFVPPSEGALPGITQELVKRICGALGIVIQERLGRLEDILGADEVFVTSSGLGVVRVKQVGGVQWSESPLVNRIRAAYLELICDSRIEEM